MLDPQALETKIIDLATYDHGRLQPSAPEVAPSFDDPLIADAAMDRLPRCNTASRPAGQHDSSPKGSRSSVLRADIDGQLARPSPPRV